MLKRGFWAVWLIVFFIFGTAFAQERPDLVDNDGNGIPDVYDKILREVAKYTQPGAEQQPPSGGVNEVIPQDGVPSFQLLQVGVASVRNPGDVNVMPNREAWVGEAIVVWGNVNSASPSLAYTLDFGDGNVSTGNVVNPRYIAENHVYATVGYYTAMLTVKDGATVLGGEQVKINVLDPTVLSPEDKLKIDVNQAIQDGLRWLYITQNPAGYWYWGGWGTDRVCVTSEVILAFENQGYLPTNDPNVDIYAEYVQMGLNYIVSQKLTASVGVGEPDVNSNGFKVYWAEVGRYPLTTGMVMAALVASGDTSAYLAIIEDVVDYVAWAQCDSGSGRGGWGYGYQSYSSDNSNAQWPVLGLYAAELWGVTIPSFVKSELNFWIDYIQNDVTGGSGYGSPWDWSGQNVAMTGALLIEQALYGDTWDPANTTSRVYKAVALIDSMWDTTATGEWWSGANRQANFANYYAMYGVMKGFRLLDVETLPSGLDWYSDLTRGYAQYLVAKQNPEGSWPQGTWTGWYGYSSPITTAWAILILSPTVIGPPVIIVQIDIKPGSWPNSINLGDKGVISVAILTTKDFDATTVDPLSVKFGPAGATEYHGKGHIEDADKDGDLDMVLHFETLKTGLLVTDTQACLTGKTVDGKNIKGYDAVRIVPPKGKPAPEASLVSEALPPYPQPSNPETWIPFKLAQGSEVVVTIYNVDGRLIRSLALGYHSPGVYVETAKAAHWDGKNEKGEDVSSGVYFYTIQAGDFTATRKILIVR